MIAEAASRHKDSPIVGFVEAVMDEQVSRWLAACSNFLHWHRTKWLVGLATPEENAQADRVLHWLIRTTRYLHGETLDPAFPRKDIAKELEIALWQLEEAWAVRHNPMTEAEADKVLTDLFPPHAT